MKVSIDNGKYITGYATVGDINDSIDYNGVVPEDFTEHYYAYQLIDGHLVKEESRVAEKINEEALYDELNQLYEWFNEYDNQVKQYERSRRLGEAFDRDMTALDQEAAIKQQRIRAIKNTLNMA